jgi:hypothetical protein
MTARKTTKRKVRTPKPATIPALKHSFDSLDRAVADILRAKLSQKQAVKKFQEQWRRIFGRPVDAIAAAAYLQVKQRGNRRSTRKQRGGAALAGAPLDFQTRPGVDGAHGSFPAYVSNGFGVGVPQPGLFQGCGIENITPNVPATMGSNAVKGGGMLQAGSDALYSLTTRPFSPTAPPSALYMSQEAALGRPPMPPAAPEQNPGLFGFPR